MYEEIVKQCVPLLEAKGIIFGRALSDEEISAIQKKFNFIFPPDLRLLLQTGLPVSKGFPNWREALHLEGEALSDHPLMSSLGWPLEGMLFDIEHNSYWQDEWGAKPGTKQEREYIATEHFSKWPLLVPVYIHRFMPSLPVEAHNPVYSVYQMDIIYYGYELPAYLAAEFGIELPASYQWPAEPKDILYWSDVVS